MDERQSDWKQPQAPPHSSKLVPRCPTGPASNRRSHHKHLERPRELGWNKQLVRLAFAACSAVEVHSDVTAGDVQAAVARAIETWNSVGLPIRIEHTTNHFEADIVVDWKFASDDPEGTLNGHTQAHADFPPGNSVFGPPPLPLHFNADFLWGIEKAGCFDVETIGLHELAHCLGLIYHSSIDTIMYDAIGQAPLFIRHQIDVQTLARMRLLYE